MAKIGKITSKKTLELNKNIKVVKEYNYIIEMSAKCSDLYSHIIKSENGDIIDQKDGYVPNWFTTSEHYGDYIMLDIDARTGVIKNWDSFKALRHCGMKAFHYYKKKGGSK